MSKLGGDELEGIESVYGLKVVKSCSHRGISLVQTLLLYMRRVSFSHNAVRHIYRETDR